MLLVNSTTVCCILHTLTDLPEMTALMRNAWILIFCLLVMPHAAQSQETLPSPISSLYEETLSAMQTSKSPQDIKRMVEAMDSPEWVGIAPTGEKISREQAEKQLLALLSTPASQRPIPEQKIVFASHAGSRALVVYWVYRTTAGGPVGSIARDTWVQTGEGWRRSIHEKLFPDRLLKLP
jgi:hypothetical protein